MPEDEVVCVFHDVRDIVDGMDLEFVKLVKEYRSCCKLLGWRGGFNECHVWPHKLSDRFAQSLYKRQPDDGAIRWLKERKPNRVFVWTGVGTLCINVTEDGFEQAKGTTDLEWQHPMLGGLC